MNSHALHVLQFPEALGLVAGYAAGPLGAEAVRALRPANVRAEVQLELTRVEQMAAFLTRVASWAVPAVPDLRAQLRKLAIEGAMLDASVLREFSRLLQQSEETRRAFHQFAEDYPLVEELGAKLVVLPHERAAIDRAIDEAGDVRDSASRELGRLRREIRGARGRIVAQLEAYMAQLPGRYQVADASVSLREGRYVIPIRREGRGEVGGIVHDESATGHTLFIEPPVAIDLMNRLRELELAELREVQRILRELTLQLHPHAAEITEAFHALIEIDAVCARARYAQAHGGTRPELLPGGNDAYAVVHGRHPILLAQSGNVVPFDLEMFEGERTLVISGPNTGGKTVLLKAIGLISALTQAGIIPPVGPGTKLPIFDDAFADIGDEQSIEASLSTFSGHLRNIREILEHADGRSLVLMDEMGSGTDPAEGAALAQAVLVELTRRGTLTVATSHLGQLKELASSEPGVVNASLQFDSAELRPTYRLIKGLPGRSYGLAIAKRLGFPDGILSLAEAYLPSAERETTGLLEQLEAKDRAMLDALNEAEAARAEALRLKAELEQRDEQLRKREREAERRARQQARDLLLHAREEVERTIRELREAAAAQQMGVLEEAAKASRRRVEELARRQVEKTPSAREGRPLTAADLKPGTRVRVSATGLPGTVVELRDDRVLVETSGLRMQVPISGLEVLTGEPAKAAVQSKPVHTGGWTASEYTASPEVDLRGLRADEVASQLEPALDSAVRADLPSLRIIHGKGTGALRQVVIELLRTDPRVRQFRAGGLGEGGSGVTVAELA